MNSHLLFDFTVDKAAKTVMITREFDAELSLVWDAFTKQDLLDQWTAPAPYQAKTKYMNFEVGGKRFYAMLSPEGNESWTLQKYTSITPKTNFKLFNAFADKDGNPQPAGSEWNYNFSEEDGMTTVNINIYNESFERMESLLEGFQKGFTATLNNLENLLANLSQKSYENK
ncbi:MAG: SRPBCC domain-containing protein [Ferruginibacter sp.]